MKPKIAVLGSGVGSGFEALVYASRQGRLAAEIAGLIVNRSQAPAIEKAVREGVPVKAIVPADFSNRESWDLALLAQLKLWSIEWVVLAGFLTLVGPHVLKAFERRVINSHPALLPKFGGPGMFGLKVHESVLAAGEKETGVTIHWVDQQYDQGDIIDQERISIIPGESASQLQERVKALEHRIYPKVVNDLVTGRLKTR